MDDLSKMPKAFNLAEPGKTTASSAVSPCGKINVIDFKINNDISFISVECGSFKFITTNNFFQNNKILDSINRSFKKYLVPINIKQDISENLTQIKISLPDECKDISSTVNPIFNNILDFTFGKIIMNICYDSNISYANAK